MLRAMSSNPDRSEAKRRFGIALRQRRESLRLNQAELAGSLGVQQTMISNYENGIHEPAPQAAFQLERLLRCKPGDLSRLLGYVPVNAKVLRTIGTVEAVVSDPNLGEREQEALIGLYRSLVDSRRTGRSRRSGARGSR